MSTSSKTKRITTRDIRRLYSEGTSLVMLTAYSHWLAEILDNQVDIILVGDSLANVELGMETTLPVTLDAMIHHAQAVMRGVKHAMVVVDMPFMSYQSSVGDALKAAGRIMKETGAAGVKVEGAGWLDAIKTMVEAGIPVMGHIGLTPQSVHSIGGFLKRGKSKNEAARIEQEALKLQDAGCFSIVLECIPADLAGRITSKLSVPTIGIGAGPSCSGQVLVTHDMLGLLNEPPAFVKKYADLRGQIQKAVADYAGEVRGGIFP